MKWDKEYYRDLAEKAEIEHKWVIVDPLDLLELLGPPPNTCDICYCDTCEGSCCSNRRTENAKYCTHDKGPCYVEQKRLSRDDIKI